MKPTTRYVITIFGRVPLVRRGRTTCTVVLPSGRQVKVLTAECLFEAGAGQ